MSLSRRKGVIFVFDDEAAFRDSLQDAFEDSGYFVLPARSGTEALARMHRFSGHAIAIIDLNMPGMDGWELIETMRADEELAHIPIFVVSSQEGQPVQGADRVFRKPLVLDELLRAVQELMP